MNVTSTSAIKVYDHSTQLMGETLLMKKLIFIFLKHQERFFNTAMYKNMMVNALKAYPSFLEGAEIHAQKTNDKILMNFCRAAREGRITKGTKRFVKFKAFYEQLQQQFKDEKPIVFKEVVDQFYKTMNSKKQNSIATAEKKEEKSAFKDSDLANRAFIRLALETAFIGKGMKPIDAGILVNNMFGVDDKKIVNNFKKDLNEIKEEQLANAKIINSDGINKALIYFKEFYNLCLGRPHSGEKIIVITKRNPFLLQALKAYAHITETTNCNYEYLAAIKSYCLLAEAQLLNKTQDSKEIEREVLVICNILSSRGITAPTCQDLYSDSKK